MKQPPRIAPRPVVPPPRRSAPVLPEADPTTAPLVFEEATRRPMASLPDMTADEKASMALAKVATLDTYHELLDERDRRENERHDRLYRDVMRELAELKATDANGRLAKLESTVGDLPNPLKRGDAGSGMAGMLAQVLNSDRVAVREGSRTGALAGTLTSGSIVAIVGFLTLLLQRC